MMKRIQGSNRVNAGLLAAAGLAFALLAIVAIGIGLRERVTAPIDFFGTPYPEPESAPALRLVDHEERPASLDDYRGEVVLLFFGFTHCPDVCPLTLARLASVREGMGAAGDAVRILLITVDPERDSPAALAEYVSRFGGSITGLTGEPEVLESIRRDYGVFAVAHGAHGEPTGESMVAHTDAVFGIDRAGLLRVLIRPDAPEHEIEADLRVLLRS